MPYRLAAGRELDDVLEAVSRGRSVYALEEGDAGQYYFGRADGWVRGRHTLAPYRPVEPVKTLLFRPREFLGSTTEAALPAELPERVIFGIKNCDLSALRIHDHVFLEEPFVDPVYAELREKAGIPDEIRFLPKWKIALEQIDELLEEDLPPAPVVADAGYGDTTAFREELTEMGFSYAVGIKPETTVWPPGKGPLPPKPYGGRGRPPKRVRRAAQHQPLSVRALAETLPL